MRIKDEICCFAFLWRWYNGCAFNILIVVDTGAGAWLIRYVNYDVFELTQCVWRKASWYLLSLRSDRVHCTCMPNHSFLCVYVRCSHYFMFTPGKFKRGIGFLFLPFVNAMEGQPILVVMYGGELLYLQIWCNHSHHRYHVMHCTITINQAWFSPRGKSNSHLLGRFSHRYRV